MTHRVHHRLHQSARNNPATTSVVVVLAALIFLVALLQSATRPAVSSVEVKFTDSSARGLSIVPASCDSIAPYKHPEYPDECDTGANPGQCTIRFSDALITDGESSTLTWQWTPAQTTFPSSYSSGSITPTIGSVGKSGSQLVSPHVTTVYQYSGTSVSFFGLIRRSFSCSSTLTVTAPRTDQCLNIDGIQDTVPPNHIRNSSGDCFLGLCPARTWSCGTGANADRLYYTDYTAPLCTPEVHLSSICYAGCLDSGNGTANCNSSTIFNPSVAIEVRPALVQQGTKVLVSWRTVDAQASTCRVTGTNGDGKGINSTGWAGLARGSKDSSPINSQTVYTISCTMRNLTQMSQSATVNTVPRFCEAGAPGCE